MTTTRNFMSPQLRALFDALRDERRHVDAALAHLLEAKRIRDGLTKEAPARSRRGRKSMGPEERAIVSARMRKYWQARRDAAAALSIAAAPVRDIIQ